MMRILVSICLLVAAADQIHGSQPMINSEEGDLNVKVGENKDINFERTRRETVDVFQLLERIKELENNCMTQKDVDAAVDRGFKAALDTVGTTVSTSVDVAARLFTEKTSGFAKDLTDTMINLQRVEKNVDERLEGNKKAIDSLSAKLTDDVAATTKGLENSLAATRTQVTGLSNSLTSLSNGLATATKNAADASSTASGLASRGNWCHAHTSRSFSQRSTSWRNIDGIATCNIKIVDSGCVKVMMDFSVHGNSHGGVRIRDESNGNVWGKQSTYGFDWVIPSTSGPWYKRNIERIFCGVPKGDRKFRLQGRAQHNGYNFQFHGGDTNSQYSGTWLFIEELKKM